MNVTPLGFDRWAPLTTNIVITKNNILRLLKVIGTCNLIEVLRFNIINGIIIVFYSSNNNI